MNMTWNLDRLYPSFESEKLRGDRELLSQLIIDLCEELANCSYKITTM
jgi:hypothetical protein